MLEYRAALFNKKKKKKKKKKNQHATDQKITFCGWPDV